MTLDTAISAHGLAKRLGVKPCKVYTWIASGQLRAVNLAADQHGDRPRWKILPDDLREFLDGRAASPPPPEPRRRAKTTVRREYF